MTELPDIFLNKKAAKTVTTVLKKKHKPFIGEISKEVDTTYAHTVKIIKKIQEETSKQFFTTEKQGRKKHIGLTSEGREIASVLQKIMDKENQSQGLNTDLTIGSPIKK